MIRSLLILFQDRIERGRLGLFSISALLALVVGFIVVSPPAAEHLIAGGGYYYMLGLFSLFVLYACRVIAPRRDVVGGWFRHPGWPGVVIGGAAAFAVWSDPFNYKILFDEYVLQGTAFHMHATKEIGTTIRAYDIWGTWLPIDTFLDKRPYFFTFLVSLLHDFTGYRMANVFVLNVLLAPAFLGLVYWLGRTLAGRGPALVAVGLLATMPLLGQQATGAGMELHNLTMLTLVMALAVLYLRAPDPDRLSLLVLGTILLAESRYESVIFVVPAALVIVVGWMRVGRAFLSWPAIFAPLLLIPYAWHNRVLSATPLLWQLRAGQTSRFSWDYLRSNLEGAWTFFFNFGPGIANSAYLSIVGALGIVWAMWQARRWSRSPQRPPVAPGMFVLLVFGAGIAGHLGLIMFYYWSRLDDVIASRFALPMCLLLALIAALFIRSLEDRGWRAARFAALGLGVWVLGWGLPAISRHLYTSQNLVMQEVAWEHDELLRLPGPLLFISNKSTIPFVLWHVPTIINGVGRLRVEQIKFHLDEGTFKQIVVAQALRPTSAEGDMGVDPEDVMPANFRLEPFAERRFGARWARLSRLVAIELETPPAKSDVAPGPGAAPPFGADAPRIQSAATSGPAAQ